MIALTAAFGIIMHGDQFGVDLTEGFAHIMLLTGHESFMGLKVLATPIELMLYILGLCITGAGLVLA